MGQVFKVKIQGKDFVIKILHPGIKKKLQKEIQNILLLGGHFAKMKGFEFDKRIFHHFLTEVFEEETDLIREGEFQENFHRLFELDHRFHIPKVIKEYSNESILCQEPVWCDLARDLEVIGHFHIFDFFFDALLNHGLLHGDLNDRNWGLRDEKTIIYDFGCSQIISQRRLSGFNKLLRNEDIIEGLKEFGVRLESTWFKGKEQELRDALFSPLLDRVITPDWSYSAELQEKYQDKIKMLRQHTDPWVLLMMRSLFSLIKTYQSKNIPIPLGEILSPYQIKKEREMTATQIKIEVLEDHKQIISMTLPLTAIDNMEFLMPEKVMAKIVQEGIKLDAIIKGVKESHFISQELFNLCLDRRTYRVWIE
jgi:hypothetical protein